MKSIINYLKKRNENKLKEKAIKIIRKLSKKNIKNSPNLATFIFDNISGDLAVHGIYSLEKLNALYQLIILKHNTKNMICLDIGAHIGNHSIFFSNYFKKIISFEPHPDTYSLLSFNVRNLKNIHTYNLGLSDQNGVSNLYRDNPNEYTSASLNKKKIKNKMIEKVKIKLAALDYLDINIDKYKKKIFLIKIDVENFEENVLKGMTKTLEKNNSIILIEQHKVNFFLEGNDSYTSRCVKLLKKLNYNFFYEIENSWQNKNFYEKLKSIITGKKANHKLVEIKKFEKKSYELICSKFPIIN